VSKTSDLDLQLRQIVFGNLQSAAEGGQFENDGSLFGATAEEIADDLVALAADCEAYQAADLLPYVREWIDIGTPIARAAE
jgi:hypothetical protein